MRQHNQSVNNQGEIEMKNIPEKNADEIPAYRLIKQIKEEDSLESDKTKEKLQENGNNWRKYHPEWRPTPEEPHGCTITDQFGVSWYRNGKQADHFTPTSQINMDVDELSSLSSDDSSEHHAQDDDLAQAAILQAILNFSISNPSMPKIEDVD